MREIEFFIVNYDSGNNQAAHPIYPDGFGIVTERESGQIFFRNKLNDKLTFVAEDYNFIMSEPFDSQIDLIMTVKDNGAITMQWHGKFSRTDCTINEVDGIVIVTPEVQDQYTDILNCLEKEFNLSEMDIPQKAVTLKVPPVMQIYYAGADIVSNYWQGDVWQTEVAPIDDVTVLQNMGFHQSFAFLTATGIYGYVRILKSSSGSGEVNDDYNVNKIYKYYYGNWNGIKLVFSQAVSASPTPYGQKYVNGQSVGYYVMPADATKVYIPFRGVAWGQWSYWIEVNKTETTDIDDPMQTVFFPTAYPLSGLLQGLLSANGLALQFSDAPTYSLFFYGAQTPITGWVNGWDLLFTAKSNLLKYTGEDTEMATKTPCTLATILNFLKNALNVFWSVESGQLRLEHISYYKNGGTYSGTPTTQCDLTQIVNPRSGKPWAWGQNQYQFEKNTIPEIVKWSWMDKTDDFFDGSGFECVSNYVAKGRTEEITVANITTNISQMFMQPEKFSLDGMAVIFSDASGKTDYTTFTRNGGNWRTQNGELAMWELQQGLLLYDAPCDKIEVSGALRTGVDYKRTKYNEVTFPALTVDPAQHITTNVGDGAPETVTNDLTSNSIKVKLKYGNE